MKKLESHELESILSPVAYELCSNTDPLTIHQSEEIYYVSGAWEFTCHSLEDLNKSLANLHDELNQEEDSTMTIVKRLNGQEVFESKQEVVAFFGESFDPVAADQGEMVITDDNGQEHRIASRSDWEDYAEPKYYRMSEPETGATAEGTVFDLVQEFNIETDEDTSHWTIEDILSYANDNGAANWEVQ